MCDLNGPFRVCSCSSSVVYTIPHLILRINIKNERIDASVMIGIMTPLNLIDKIERRKILRRLNTINVFDFEYLPYENDQLELNFEEEDGYKFTFKKNKWVLEEWYGEHPAFEHEIQKEGIIESLPSKLKKVYNQYLSVLEDGQPDIVQDNWSDQRMSEKSLIDYMQRRINRVD